MHYSLAVILDNFCFKHLDLRDNLLPIIDLKLYTHKDKWDYYNIGGRFFNQLAIHKNHYDPRIHGDFIPVTYRNFGGYVLVNHAQIQEIHFDVINKLTKKTFINNWKKSKSLNTYDSFFKYGIGPTTKRKDYISSCNFSTWAVLDNQNVWHERDESKSKPIEQDLWQDWNDNYYNKFIANVNPSSYLVVLDCHC